MLLTSTTAGAYPGKAQKWRRVQALPRKPAPGGTVTCRCPTPGLSLPVCKMNNSTDTSANSKAPRWPPSGLHA